MSRENIELVQRSYRLLRDGLKRWVASTKEVWEAVGLREQTPGGLRGSA